MIINIDSSYMNSIVVNVLFLMSLKICFQININYRKIFPISFLFKLIFARYKFYLIVNFYFYMHLSYSSYKIFVNYLIVRGLVYVRIFMQDIDISILCAVRKL